VSNEDRIKWALGTAEWRGNRHDRPLGGNYAGAATTLAEAYLASRWQPIETAPRDGRTVLLFDGSEFETGYWENLAVQWVNDFFEKVKIQPTHWMAIPAAPVTTP